MTAREPFSAAHSGRRVPSRGSTLDSAFEQKALLSSEILLKELHSTYPLSVTMKETIEA
jgi:hypothetical protein